VKQNGGIKRGRALAAIACTVILASAVAATDADAAPSADNRVIAIDLRARVAPRCGVKDGSRGSIDANQDLEDAARLTLRIGLDCNTPYAFGVTASHGALVNLDVADDHSGYAFRKVYGLAVTLNTDAGAVHSTRCRSTDLVQGGRCAFAGNAVGEGLKSGRGISIDRDAVLTIDWPSQSTLPRRLAPGHYRDTLTITVGANA